MALLTERLKKIRSTDPKKFALFTGRDQHVFQMRPERGNALPFT